MVSLLLATLRRWLGPLLLALVVLMALLLLLSPAERTLGQAIKLVYLHGALVRTALIIFAVSLPVNLIALVTGRVKWFTWGKAMVWSAVIIWLTHTLFSMITTYATWGVFIAWFEPRTRFTFNLAAVSIIVVAVAQLVGNHRFSALVFALLSGLTLGLLPGLDFVQHPLNPIGTSPSGSIRLFYAAIFMISMGIAGLLVIWLQDKVSTQPA